MNKKASFFFLLFMTVSTFSFAECIPINGLKFERISGEEVIASKEGKNYAVLIISTRGEDYRRSGALPNKIGAFRFFTEELCTSGAESRFHIDGQLYYLHAVTLFKK